MSTEYLAYVDMSLRPLLLFALSDSSIADATLDFPRFRRLG
jgi:hypothetical protein